MEMFKIRWRTGEHDKRIRSEILRKYEFCVKYARRKKLAIPEEAPNTESEDFDPNTDTSLKEMEDTLFAHIGGTGGGARPRKAIQSQAEDTYLNNLLIKELGPWNKMLQEHESSSDFQLADAFAKEVLVPITSTQKASENVNYMLEFHALKKECGGKTEAEMKPLMTEFYKKFIQKEYAGVNIAGPIRAAFIAVAEPENPERTWLNPDTSEFLDPRSADSLWIDAKRDILKNINSAISNLIRANNPTVINKLMDFRAKHEGKLPIKLTELPGTCSLELQKMAHSDYHNVLRDAFSFEDYGEYDYQTGGRRHGSVDYNGYSVPSDNYNRYQSVSFIRGSGLDSYEGVSIVAIVVLIMVMMYFIVCSIGVICGWIGCVLFGIQERKRKQNMSDDFHANDIENHSN